MTQLVASQMFVSSIPARSHALLEIGHEIIFTVILLLPLIQEGLLSVTSESMCKKYSLGNSLVKRAQEKSVVTWAD